MHHEIRQRWQHDTMVRSQSRHPEPMLAQGIKGFNNLEFFKAMRLHPWPSHLRLCTLDGLVRNPQEAFSVMTVQTGFQ